MRGLHGDKRVFQDEPDGSPWHILWDDRAREMAFERIARIPVYQSRILYLRSILYDIFQWNKYEGSDEEFKRIIAAITRELGKDEGI